MSQRSMLIEIPSRLDLLEFEIVDLLSLTTTFRFHLKIKDVLFEGWEKLLPNELPS